MPPRPYRRFSTLTQLTLSLAAFVVAILLLDSSGLRDWALRLDLGPEQTVALHVTGPLDRTLQHLGLDRFRHDLLLALARHRWSDDPALEAEANGRPSIAPPTQPVVTAPAHTPGAATPPAVVPPTNPAGTSNPPPAAPGGAPPPTGPLPAAPEGGTLQPLHLPDVAKSRRTVALAGDSMMAVGLSTVLLREAPQHPELQFVRVFRSGTGLARPEVFDWQREYPAMLGAAHPDVVLVAIGANDGQGFVDNGVVCPFGTPEWQAIYRRRVAAFLAMLGASGAEVVWLGLPPMKSPAFNDRIDLINRIAYAVVRGAPHAVWLGMTEEIGDSAGHFRDFGPVAGHTARLRQPDGIHLSDEGASLLTSKLILWLDSTAAPEPVPAAAL